VEPFWNRRRMVRVVLVFVLPTLVAGLLGGRFWAGGIGFFGIAALAVLWLIRDDSEELHRGEYATDRNRRLHSMRFPFHR
jgi:Trk-type K+ transport system membrane component